LLDWQVEASLSDNDIDVKYKVVLKKSKEGYSVSCPGLPGCWSQGKTEEKALENITLVLNKNRVFGKFAKPDWE
jgi:hypothetical protein